MKNYHLILLCFYVFISCKSNSKTPVKDTLKNSAAANHQADSLIKIFKPFIQGVWVKSDYVNDLKNTRSPFASKEKLGGVASLIINLADERTDSTHIGYSLNNHEGSDFVLYFKKGQMETSLKTGLPDYDIKSNFYELGYSLIGNDTSLVLYHYNKERKIINKIFYTRVALKAEDETDAAWGITYITNKLLITGKYLAIDTAGTNSSVEFGNDGKVSGFQGYKSFYINTDFAAGPENNVDDIVFDLNTKTHRPYIYNFKDDTLYFYVEGANADSTELVPGKLKYKLVRQK